MWKNCPANVKNVCIFWHNSRTFPEMNCNGTWIVFQKTLLGVWGEWGRNLMAPGAILSKNPLIEVKWNLAKKMESIYDVQSRSQVSSKKGNPKGANAISPKPAWRIGWNLACDTCRVLTSTTPNFSPMSPKGGPHGPKIWPRTKNDWKFFENFLRRR